MRNHRRFAAFVVIGALVLCLAAGALWLVREDGLTLREDWAVLVVVILAATGALVSLVRLFRTYPHEGLSMLWCRRFSTGGDFAESRNRWLQKILVEASYGVVLPITLRDHSVSWTRSIADSLEVPLTLAIVFIGMPGFIWLAVVLPDGFLDGWWGFLIVIVAYGSVWTVIVALLGWLLTSLATYRGRPEQLQRMVRKAMAKRRSRSDTFVVRCTDDDWQDCVQAVLAEASLVIVDATGSTDNIEWEVRCSLEELGPERTLLLQETYGDRAVERAVDRAPIRDDLQNALACTFLRYGEMWVDDERKAFLDAESDSGGDGRLGPRSAAIAAAVRDWMMAPKPERMR